MCPPPPSPPTCPPVPLLSSVHRSLESSSANDNTNIEYTKQLLLSCLHNICNKVAPEGGPVEQGAWSQPHIGGSCGQSLLN